jgi:hypothetical protein
MLDPVSLRTLRHVDSRHPGAAPVARGTLLDAMADSLAAGPDDRGVWSDDEAQIGLCTDASPSSTGRPRARSRWCPTAGNAS